MNGKTTQYAFVFRDSKQLIKAQYATVLQKIMRMDYGKKQKHFQQDPLEFSSIFEKGEICKELTKIEM